MSDVYYNPEDFGLTVVAEVEWSEPCYSFDTTVVWKKDELFYWASDSGCSCPSPFEGMTLDDVESGTKAQAIAALQTYQKESYDSDYAAPQVVEAISKILAG